MEDIISIGASIGDPSILNNYNPVDKHHFPRLTSTQSSARYRELLEWFASLGINRARAAVLHRWAQAWYPSIPRRDRNGCIRLLVPQTETEAGDFDALPHINSTFIHHSLPPDLEPVPTSPRLAAPSSSPRSFTPLRVSTPADPRSPSPSSLILPEAAPSFREPHDPFASNEEYVATPEDKEEEDLEDVVSFDGEIEEPLFR